jgi:hypothetical protein
MIIVADENPKETGGKAEKLAPGDCRRGVSGGFTVFRR